MAESTWKEKHRAAPPDTRFLQITTCFRRHLENAPLAHTEGKKKKTNMEEIKAKPPVSSAAQQQIRFTCFFSVTFAGAF